MSSGFSKKQFWDRPKNNRSFRVRIMRAWKAAGCKKTFAEGAKKQGFCRLQNGSSGKCDFGNLLHTRRRTRTSGRRLGAHNAHGRAYAHTHVITHERRHTQAHGHGHGCRGQRQRNAAHTHTDPPQDTRTCYKALTDVGCIVHIITIDTEVVTTSTPKGVAISHRSPSGLFFYTRMRARHERIRRAHTSAHTSGQGLRTPRERGVDHPQLQAFESLGGRSECPTHAETSADSRPVLSQTRSSPARKYI